MNRREALAALASLPQISRVSVASLKPTDVIVAECDCMLSQEMAARIKRQLEDVWPGRKVLVCDRGIRIKVVEE